MRDVWEEDFVLYDKQRGTEVLKFTINNIIERNCEFVDELRLQMLKRTEGENSIRSGMPTDFKIHGVYLPCK